MKVHFSGYKCTEEIKIDKNLKIRGGDPRVDRNEIPNFFTRKIDPNAYIYEDGEGNKIILGFKWSESLKAVCLRFFQAITKDISRKTLKKLCNQVFDKFIWYMEKKNTNYIFAYAGWDYEQKDGGSFEQLAAYKQKEDFWDIVGYYARKRGLEIKKTDKKNIEGIELKIFEIKYIKPLMFPKIKNGNRNIIQQ